MFGATKALSRVRPIPPLRLPIAHKSTWQVLQLQSLLPTPFRFASNSSISTSMSQNPDVSRILSFWYDRPPVQWFAPPEGFDDECKHHFGELVHKARANELDDWASEPESALAILVLLDQFSRNIFRDTPEMYAADDKAFDIATRSIARGFDEKVTPMQSLTFYLPLMHHESLIAQVATVALFKNLIARCEDGSEAKQFHSRGIYAAFGHLEVIEKFGRFPSRNNILGRESTKEELDFLMENPHGLAVSKGNQKVGPESESESK